MDEDVSNSTEVWSMKWKHTYKCYAVTNPIDIYKEKILKTTVGIPVLLTWLGVIAWA